MGTDHGYLPAKLAVSGYSGNIFASDINTGPLEAAKRTAENSGVSDRIRFLLCDGLALCEPKDVDTIVIAGMGGDTICGILDRAEWCMDKRYRLILQPMTKAEVLRYWLANNGFEICREDIVEDGGILYPLLLCRFGGQTRLSEAELFVGTLALIKQHPLFERMLALHTRRFESAYAGIRFASAEELGARAELFKTILTQLRGIKNDLCE